MRKTLDSGVVRGLFQSSTPMERTYESGRHEIAFRVAGWVRFLPAAFLAFWLCGWAAGELFAGGALVFGLLNVVSPGTPLPFGIKGAAPAGAGAWFVLGFLAFWLAMWTVGGAAAFNALAELLLLRERLRFDAGGLRAERRTLWTHVREWAPEVIEGFFLRRQGGMLEVQVGGKRHRLVTLGTPIERKAVRDELRAQFGRMASPSSATRELAKDWESWLDSEGATVLGRHRGTRRVQAAVMSGLALVSAAVVALVVRSVGWGALGQAAFWVPVTLLILPLSAGAAWLALGGREFRIRSGTIEFRRRFLSKTWSETLGPTSLELTRRVDSDGDEHWAIDAREGSRVRRVHSAMNDLGAVLALGRWLAKAVGLELKVPFGIELEE